MDEALKGDFYILATNSEEKTHHTRASDILIFPSQNIAGLP
jgi:hypothetical protein